MIVRELEAGRRAEWDAFVMAHPDGTFFHLSGWTEVFEKALGHKTHYLYAEEGGAIVGVLPLVHVKSRLFGNSLSSLAFCAYGGPLGDENVIQSFDRDSRRIAERLKVDHIEYRLRRRVFAELPCKDSLYVTFRKAISADHEANLKAIPRKQRAMVRKGISNGLTSEVDRDADRLYPIYAESVRNLGTPVFPKRLFDSLMRVFADASDVVTMCHEGVPVASVLNFYFRDEVLPYYGGGRSIARNLAANDFMYWEVMRRAADKGCLLFDFGRSKQGVGSYSFKKNWGFEPEPLFYEYRLLQGDALPDLNPLNPKYRLMIATWKKLPLPVANAIGPFLARSLG